MFNEDNCSHKGTKAQSEFLLKTLRVFVSWWQNDDGESYEEFCV